MCVDLQLFVYESFMHVPVNRHVLLPLGAVDPLTAPGGKTGVSGTKDEQEETNARWPRSRWIQTKLSANNSHRLVLMVKHQISGTTIRRKPHRKFSCLNITIYVSD